MIRKTLFLGVLALAALAAGAPALFGLYMAREFDHAVARFERPGLTHVDASRFNRGWFKSHAMIRIGLDDALCAQRPCPSLTLNSVIHHGPIPFAAPVDPDAGLQPSLGVAVTTVDIASLWPRLVFEPPLAPLPIVTRVGFDGRADSLLHVRGTSLDISRQRPLAHVDMDAMTLKAAVPLRDGAIDATLDAPQFRLIGETGGQLTWRKLTASTGSVAPVPGDQAITGQQLRIESLTWADGLGTSALLQGLAGEWQPLPTAAAGISARFNVRASRAVLNNNDTGPFMLDGEVHRIDIHALQALIRELGLLRDRDNGAFDRDARATLYDDTIPELLHGALVIDIERLLLTTADGDISAHLHIAAPEKARPARLIADVISQLDVDFGAQMPAQVVRDIAVQVMLANGRSPYAIEETDIDKALTELVGQGLIEAVPAASAYRVSLVIDNGRLRLNGRNQIGWQSVVDQFAAARERL